MKLSPLADIHLEKIFLNSLLHNKLTELFLIYKDQGLHFKNIQLVDPDE